MTSSLRPKSRLLCALFLVLTGCAVSASRDEDLSLPEDGDDEIARSVLPDGSLEDAGTNAQTQPLVNDGSVGQPPDGGTDAGHVTLDAGTLEGDAATQDAGGDAAARDASTHDASTDASAGGDAASGGSCVVSQCNVSCLTRVCCSVLDQCACEDVIGLCILPAL